MSALLSASTLPCGEASDAPLLRRATDNDRARVVEIQFAAYAKNRELLGLEPLPLLVDYAEIFATHEVWVFDADDGAVIASLILEVRDDDVLIFSVATDPHRQATGIGQKMLAASDIRARQLGRTTVRLYTGSTLQHLVDWYGRHGFATERIEQLDDRAITHMAKHLN
ncbi:MAG: GNAT family N-acetyltransferase [Pseudomonadota bacterium]